MFKFLKDYQFLLSAIILGTSLVVAAFRLASARRYALYLQHDSKEFSSTDTSILLDTFTGRRAIHTTHFFTHNDSVNTSDSLSFDNLFQDKPYNFINGHDVNQDIDP